MTLDEIEIRQRIIARAERGLDLAKKSLREAQSEYAEQEARKAGITYGKTLVNVHGKGPYFVVGMNEWFLGAPNYKVVKVKKDGTPSKAGSGQWLIRLSDMEIVGEATE
jgi:hypothetical protein